MRVATLVGGYHRFSGAQRSLYELLRALDRTAVEPIALFPGEGLCTQRFRELPLRVEVLEAPDAVQGFGGGLLRAGPLRRAAVAAGAVAPYAVKMARWLLRERIDVLHCNESRAVLLGGPGARLAGVPVIWHVRGDVSQLGRTYLHACGMLARKIFVADSIVAGVPGRYRDKFLTVGDGIELPLPPPRRTRAELGVGDGERLIASIGTVIPLKGAHHLVEAARLLRARAPELRWVLVGDSPDEPYRRWLEGRIAAAGVADRVRLAGWDPDPLDWFHAADAVVLPTVAREELSLDGERRVVHGNEGTSRTILEAMALRKPIVASWVGGVPEQIVDGVSGLLVPPSRPDALAGAVLRVARVPGLARRLGDGAEARVRERFSSVRHAAVVLEAYRALARLSARGSRRR